MKERQILYTGFSRAAWGYFFFYVDINMGAVSILPEFVGMLLFFSAIRLLEGERRELKLLQPLAMGMAAYYTLEWLLSWGGGTLDGRFPLLDLLLAAASLYFHFQFFTDLAAIGEKYAAAEESRRLLKWRAAQTVFITAMAVLRLPVLSQWKGWEYLVMGTAIAGLGICFCLMMILFSLAKTLEKA